MAQQEFYTILTAAGLAYEANRKALGLPIKLTQMSVGDGSGVVYNPDASQTALRREVWRGPINALLQDATNPSYLVGELSLPEDVGGWYVREVGFWTDTGLLYAIGKYPESFKPLLTAGAGKEFYIRAIFETSNAASVTLVVDDTIVKATRAFVIDYVAAELAKRDGKHSVRVATTAAIVLSGPQTIDGVAVIAGDRVLVKNQGTASQNGIYVVANGAWSRAADADASVEVTPGLFVPVEDGTTNGDSVWHLVTNAPITLGTTGLTFEMLAGRTGVAAGTYRSVTVDKYGRVTAGTNNTLTVAEGGTGANTAAAALANLGGAPLASPALSGTPTAPTAAPGTNSQQLANTAFVQAALAALVASSPAALDTLNELAAALGNDPNFATTVTNALAGKLDIAVPNLANFNTASAGPFMGSATAATGSPDTTAGVIWGFTFLDAAKSQSRVQLAMHTATGGFYVRVYSGTAWGAWKDFTPPADAKVARAWICFNGTGTVAIRSSHNVSSITDNGTGDYTVNLSITLPNANYAAVTSGSANDAAITGINCSKAYARTTTSFKVGTTATATGAVDFLHVDAAVFSN